VKEGITKMLMIGFAFLIIPLVHGTRIGLRRARRGVGGVRVRDKGCSLIC